MHAVKKTISISKNLIEEISQFESNFSAVVEVALTEYLHKVRIKKGLESFGKWKERSTDSVTLVNQLREEKSRLKSREDSSH